MTPGVSHLMRMLGVIDPEMRQLANEKAVVDCAPQLMPLLKNANTKETRTAAMEAFKRIVADRTDEVMFEMVLERASQL